MADTLDVLDLVEAQVEADELDEAVQALDVLEEVVVEVNVLQGGAPRIREVDAGDLILPQT